VFPAHLHRGRIYDQECRDPISDAEDGMPSELGAWINATKYRQRAAEFLELADASDHHVRERYHTIAQHYLALAELEEQVAKWEASDLTGTRTWGRET
jgi:hypothetical protein